MGQAIALSFYLLLSPFSISAPFSPRPSVPARASCFLVHISRRKRKKAGERQKRGRIEDGFPLNSESFLQKDGRNLHEMYHLGQLVTKKYHVLVMEIPLEALGWLSD